MTTITFDSYQVVNTLVKKGFTKEQAEGLLQVVKQAELNGIATKADIYTLKEEILQMENKLLRSMITIAGVQIAAIGLIIALF